MFSVSREGMTNLVESVNLVSETKPLFSYDSYANTHKNRQQRHVLKSKEIAYKHKCNKVIKRKLKKYKLRQDGAEDQDVLDVSRILVSSLIIKSPNNIRENKNTESECKNLEEFRPKNYLFKMVRRKIVKSCETLDKPEVSNKSQGNNKKDGAAQHAVETIENQEKKQTNAFKLLMDSRNKSIGSNSPGKDKNIDGSDDEELIVKKTMKAKRNMLLQKMAEAKGSLKRKEMEEYQEICIKKRMEKRANKLKSMIYNDAKVSNRNKNDITKKGDNGINDIQSDSKDDKIGKKLVKKQVKTLQIVDIFNSLEESIVIHETKQISMEDQEFINKLSPSLKKKESMLSYFKKLESDDSADNLIKVKIGLKNKKKGKKNKLSLNRNVSDDILHDSNDENYVVDQNTNDETSVNHCVNNQQEQTKAINSYDGQKHKISTQADMKGVDMEAMSIVVSENRPKRSVKRPVKYIDDAGLGSSDEELHIFTPKKKKHKESMADSTLTKVNSDKTNCEHVKPKPDKKVVKDKSEPKKPVKLAPIFNKKSVDSAALEAKQKFLQSGVPDKLKKMINQQKNNSIIGSTFPIVVHVQQTEKNNPISIEPSLNIPEFNFGEDISLKSYEDNAFKKLLTLHQINSMSNLPSKLKISTQALLQTIKEKYPKFPVYRTYQHLKGKSKGECKDFNYIELDNSIEIMNGVVDVTGDSPDRLNWTNKFKALSAKQIIGNFESIKELRKWLVLWSENEMRAKTKTTCDSGSSDYYQSDTDSRESGKSMNNLLILTGPTGSGKTSCVYAVAADLAMKVIEVNVSSKRTGKIMLQDLQEATQSHKVNRGTVTSENSQKSQEKKPKMLKKRGRPKNLAKMNVKKSSADNKDPLSGTPSSQESVRTDMSLILIDDADIVFEQDDGFSSAIVQLVQCSKRPVILVTSSLVCPHLQRFQQNGKILKMYPLLPRMLGTWLDIMCLADNGTCWPGVGAKFLNYFRGDIRKTINYLQFYTSAFVTNCNSDEETASQNIDNFKSNIDDESSSMSWTDHEHSEGRKCFDNNNIDIDSNYVWNYFTNKQSNLLFFKQPLEIFNIWWSVPYLLDILPSAHKTKELSQTDSLEDKIECITKLEAVANAMDAISLTDYFSQSNQGIEYNITCEPWNSTESDSVCEQENLDNYVGSHDISDEISHTLVARSICMAQSILSCDKKSNLQSPGMALHRQKDKVLSRHRSLTSYLNPMAVLDRRALALDYWPSCRTICRIEKTKTDVNIKRNNRFCHYLKASSVLCKSDTFDKLSDSLYFNERNELNVTNLYD